MMRGVFVAGTDTGVGKTCISMGLMRALQASGYTVTGMKPVASGCRTAASGLVNEDALHLQACASLQVPYEDVNPYAFEPPVAPHLAAESAGVQIQVPRIEAAFRTLSALSDYVVVEGVGGWLVPVNAQQTMQDVALALGLPVVLVVAIRLGCLNHALLTVQAIRAAGLPLAGWVANRIDPECACQDENVAALCRRLPAPLLADQRYIPEAMAPEQQVGIIDVAPLLPG
ncbi:MAG TPA: dethiobiotin synthase [Gammaproteobacteria bacterium]|nr:dethiobiotin synthase [Gammaproteobacteria bacterium]